MTRVPVFDGEERIMLSSQELDQAIVDLISHDRVKVPPYPAVATKLRRLVSGENYGLQEAAKIVSADHVLAADVLRYANSAMAIGTTPTTSVNDAIVRIGAGELVKLALASGLGAQSEAKGPLVELRRKVWRQGLTHAALCEALAPRRGVPTDEAFICGLLHDFGQVIAIACLEHLLSSRKDELARPSAFWVEVIDRYHVELGLVLAAKWNLPTVISEVISGHHRPVLPSSPELRKMVELVKSADAIVDALEQESHLSAEALQRLGGLRDREEIDFVDQVLIRIPSVVAAFYDLPTSAAVQRPPPTSAVEKPETTLRGTLCPVELKVTGVQGMGNVEFVCRHLAANGLVMHGEASLVETRLVRVQLEGDPPITLWAKVALCVGDEGGGYRIELHPFALNRETQGEWNRVLRAAQG